MSIYISFQEIHFELSVSPENAVMLPVNDTMGVYKMLSFLLSNFQSG